MVTGGVKPMNAGRKKNLLLLGGAVALFIVAAVVALSLFDFDAYKPKIETAASEATGLDVGIKGKIGLTLFPFGFSAGDIHIAGKGGQVLVLERLGVGVELFPLLRGRLAIIGCEVVKPSVTIVKETDGTYNFARMREKTRTRSPRMAVGLNELKLSSGTLAYLDKKTGERIEITGINLAIRDLSLADSPGEVIRNLSFKGIIDCRELVRKDLKIGSITGAVKAERGVFRMTPLAGDIFGAKGEGDVTVDMSEADAEYKINLTVPKLDFEKLAESFGAKGVIGGKGDLAVSLTAKEKAGRNLLNGWQGSLTLRGNNLATYTADLDKVLSAYETNEKFSLVDVGAFFVTGPLGFAALKAYHYGDLFYQIQGGRGTVVQFISRWRIANGEADAVDCALATRNNRVALKGKLNFVSERYDGVTVALLDDRGCAKFRQSITGSFGSPQVAVVSAIESLIGPLIDLYRKEKRITQGGRCEVFYNGAVQHPR
jgi:uncharacterized protein involved in outer membrane biogenesis